ncbi:MAG TPA: arginine deiminase family protein [Patescibacteria group bacterium]|nr:arginine deiminase family protein [Patescibacteria group bacterium]
MKPTHSKELLLATRTICILNRAPDAQPDTNNQIQAKNAAAGNGPKREESTAELHNLARTLEQNGITVYSPEACSPDTGVVNQMYARDIGFVIGNTFFRSSMSRPNRVNEWQSIAGIMQRMPEGRMKEVPRDVVVEGGDIVVDKGNVFVGISQRTTREGFDYISTQASTQGLTAVPVHLRSLREGADVLHLDCAFVPVGEDSALIFEDGMTDVPSEIRDRYNLIRVTADEQQDLATNVLAISPTGVVARHSATRVNREMTKRGIDVIGVQFDEAPRAGGSLRCCTLPLARLGIVT